MSKYLSFNIHRTKGKNTSVLVYDIAMEVRFGKIVTASNEKIFSAQPKRDLDGNFFSSNPDSENQNERRERSSSGLRMNDYDSNILENNAYQLIEDEMFKLEHKIGILENTLSRLNSEIDALENLNYDIQVPALKDRRQKLERELEESKKKYSQMGISAKISGGLVSAVNFTSGKKNNVFSKAKNFVTKRILAKISKKFGCSQNIKEALANLSDINTSVDELITLQTPYGESVNRYEKLGAYLNEVNVIHSRITKNVNSITEAKKKS